MIKLSGTRLPVAPLDRHLFICDLLYFEGSILSLFRFQNQNWLYLWCDTDEATANRWLLFTVSRANLISYLKKTKSLRELVTAAPQILALDQKVNREGTALRDKYRTLRKVEILAEISAYLPADDAFFDEGLAPDISLTRGISPTSYDVPIDGQWFFSDLDRFSGLYSQLYAFFYCTKPRFVNNLGVRVQKYLSSPWRGGFSRVNLFEALGRLVPSLHDLEIKQIRYASPGEIRIEALESVGESIALSVTLYVAATENLGEIEKAINTLLSSGNLKRSNLSKQRDDELPLTKENKEFLRKALADIADTLNLNEEITQLSSFSPNMVVTAKVVLSLLVRLRKLAEFRQAGQVTF